jgi:hypothetical protein
MDSAPQQQNEPTFGERAVGLAFNPSSGDTHTAVDDLKIKAAAFIDECNRLRDLTDDGEVKRMFSVAITEAQTAQMWAVKAITWRS